MTSLPAGSGSDPVLPYKLNEPVRAQLFPPSSYWNLPIIDAQPDPNLASAIGVMHFYQGTLEGQRWMCYDFGPDSGIPYIVVENEPTRPIQVNGAVEGELKHFINAPFPLERNGDLPPFERGPNRRIVIYDKGSEMLYEFYGASFDAASNQVSCISVGVWNVKDQPEPDAFATGYDVEYPGMSIMPVLPGLVKPWELLDAAGNPKSAGHALRILSPVLRPNAYVKPATGFINIDGNRPNNNLFPILGSKVRLKKDFDISTFPPYAQAILMTLKEYGGVIAGKGTLPFAITGIQSKELWTHDILGQLDTLTKISGVTFLGCLEFVAIDPGRLVTA